MPDPACCCCAGHLCLAPKPPQTRSSNNKGLTCARLAGIGRSIERLEQIEELQRPLSMEDGGIVLMDLLWSDPTTNDGIQGVQPSPRGPGLVTFGPDRVKSFCQANNLQARSYVTPACARCLCARWHQHCPGPAQQVARGSCVPDCVQARGLSTHRPSRAGQHQLATERTQPDAWGVRR